MSKTRWPDWRLIKFAPKDGRNLLLCEEGERGSQYVGYWHASYEYWADPADCGPLHFHPTHFAPLPSAVGTPAVGEVA